MPAEPENRNYRYNTTDSPIIYEPSFNITEYKEFNVYYKKMGSYERVEGSMQFNEDIMYTNHIITKQAKALVPGLKLKKTTILGSNENNKFVYAGVNGIVESILPYGDSQYLVSCFNAESVTFETSIYQTEFYEYKIDYDTTFQYLLPNENAYDLEITEIDYDVKHGYYGIKLMPKTVNNMLLPGSDISLRIRTGTDDCPTYIKKEAIEGRGLEENVFMSFYVYVNGEYQQRSGLVGRTYGDLVGLYILNNWFPLVTKIYIKVTKEN
jgi:hypothetical protein